MAAELFVDTSAWYPIANPREAAHARMARALRAAVEGGRRVVTTNLVVAETHALLLHRVHAAAALAFVREVGRRPHVVVTSTRDLESRATTDWLERFVDQEFSLTDAVSFAVMAGRKITEALALDHHFAVAGFTVVPGR